MCVCEYCMGCICTNVYTQYVCVIACMNVCACVWFYEYECVCICVLLWVCYTCVPVCMCMWAVLVCVFCACVLCLRMHVCTCMWVRVYEHAYCSCKYAVHVCVGMHVDALSSLCTSGSVLVVLWTRMDLQAIGNCGNWEQNSGPLVKQQMFLTVYHHLSSPRPV